MKKHQTILLVDDEEDILDFVRYNLAAEGFFVICASCGKECLEVVKKHHPDLILLDVMMPKMSGIEVCQKLKNNDNTKDIPIIMLTAKTTESDIIEGLNFGADDYIVKPFSLKILTARIKALLRRTKKAPVNIITAGDIAVNTKTREVLLTGKKIELTFSQFEILLLFVKNLETVFTRKQIVKAIRGDNYPVTERAVDVHIVEMRKLLKDYGTCIKTVRGVGYKLSLEALNFSIIQTKSDSR